MSANTAGIVRLEVRRLLERDGERDLDAESREHLVGPGVGADHHAAAACTTRPRSPRRAASRGRRCPTTGVEPRNDAPCADARRCIAAVPRAAGTIAPRDWYRPSVPAGGSKAGQRRRISATSSSSNSMPTSRNECTIVDRRDDALRREEIETADDGDELLARLVLEPRPVVVGLAGEPDVRRRVVAVPQDPRRVVRGAAAVAELELLEPDDRVTARGELPRRGRAERAQPHNDVVDLSHGRWRTDARRSPVLMVRFASVAHSSLGSNQRRMSAESSSMGANQPWV